MTDKTRLRRGVHPNSLANLKPFQKGNRANPQGRPKQEDCLLGCIKEELLKEFSPGITNEQKIAESLTRAAAMGSSKAQALLLAYLHARPAQAIDINKDAGFIIRVIRDSGDTSQNP